MKDLCLAHLFQVLAAQRADNSDADENGGQQFIIHAEASSTIEELAVRLGDTVEEVVDFRVSFTERGIHNENKYYAKMRVNDFFEQFCQKTAVTRRLKVVRCSH